MQTDKVGGLVIRLTRAGAAEDLRFPDDFALVDDLFAARVAVHADAWLTDQRGDVDAHGHPLEIQQVFVGHELIAEQLSLPAIARVGGVLLRQFADVEARRDADGYFWVIGRVDDVIKVSGYRLGTAEIESALNEMPGVAESAIVGVPHPDFGEVGVAVVIARPGATLDADRLMAELKASLANFKIPKRCFIATELPRNTMGKVQKNLLREQHKGLFAGA